jgi:hypothetical protein
MRVRRAVVVQAGVLSLACFASIGPGGCSSSSSGGPAPTPAPTARFKLAGSTLPNVLDVPFPSNAYLVNGKIVDPLPGARALIPQNTSYITHELGKTNGFGRASFSLFYVDAPSQETGDGGSPTFAVIDPSSLPASESACIADTSSVFVLDLAATDPAKARIRCRAAIHDDSATSGAQPVLGIGPGLGIVLEEGHEYAAVLTSRVADKTGAHVAASADFQALLSGRRNGALDTLYGSAIAKAKTLLAGALAKDGAQIVAIAPYTTQSTSAEMFKLRETLEALPVPTLAWDAQSMAPMGAVKFAALVNGALPAGFTASIDDWLGAAPKLPDGSDNPDYVATTVLPHDKIAAIGAAVYQGHSFLHALPGGYYTLDNATFARNAAGDIVLSPEKPTVPIWVSLAIPSAPMPAGGYPCVIVAHGSPGSRAEMFMSLANVLAAQGWIVAGIDLITDGARAPEGKYQVDQLSDWQSAPGAKYKGPDGLADGLDTNGKPAPTWPPTGNYDTTRNSAVDILGQGVNYGAGRDQVRQAEMDISELARVLASNPDLSPLKTGATVPKIDPMRIAYVGGSMGALTGAVAAAFEPLVRTWVLNVNGGHLVLTAGSAPTTEQQVKQGALVLGIQRQFVDETNPAMNLLQIVVDAFDPLTFASYLVKSPGSIAGQKLAPRNILATEVLYDETVGNDGTEAWARAAGIGLAVPNVGPNAGVVTMAEVRDPSKVPDRISLPDVNPDGQQLIHDTPMAGVTAVMVQASPGTHYRNLTISKGERMFPVPFNASTPPLALTKEYWVRHSYVEQWAMVTRFLADAFAGSVPNVTGFKPPVRDVDDDGSPDATDPDPNDPTVK